MFQNIIDEEIEEQNSEVKQKSSKRKINIKNIFSLSDIVICCFIYDFYGRIR